MAGKSTPSEIFVAIEEQAYALDPSAFREVVERTALHSSMTGVLDAEWEVDEDEIVEQDTENVAATRLLLEAPDSDFVVKPFWKAVEDFIGRQPVTRAVWDQMRGGAQLRAFTVAGLTEARFVADVQDELAKAIEEGIDLREFRKRLKERMASRGWMKAGSATEVPTKAGSPWHVETIFRNGVRSSYSAGRKEQMSQPHVLAARPYWQIRTVPDARRRPEHASVHGWVLPADDPFWRSTGFPPWGHNCRCRVVSRSVRDVERRGLEVHSGSEVEGIPDEGWDSGGDLAEAAEQITLPPGTKAVLEVDDGASLPTQL